MDAIQFNDFYWHDAVLENIAIDRSKPGVIDEVRLNIKWPNSMGYSTIVFEEIYRVIMKLNMGIVASENILHAFLGDNNDIDIANLYLEWKGQFYDVVLSAYTIELNSSGGFIKILATGFRVEECNSATGFKII